MTTATDLTPDTYPGVAILQGGKIVQVGSSGIINILSGGQLQAAGVLAGPTAALTDSTGGTASNTLSAITAALLQPDRPH